MQLFAKSKASSRKPALSTKNNNHYETNINFYT